ncbi:hypothetical protein [Alkalicoccobacillus murimartini]|uniref:Uncharacterized protein n=1 Tax=Alkalicoccobacillus murimartini TaxID=171685 RepID=A0ABT9YLL6_9BACI|nr:hypothetical protein [Alkalicoccobacillus murimartini]MDQ0208631.1 hypothetical protein [Alkalicoccobacillus murimartini]
MDKSEHNVTLQQLKGKVISDLEITEAAVVLKFEDNTFLDIYLDQEKQVIKTSTNKL